MRNTSRGLTRESPRTLYDSPVSVASGLELELLFGAFGVGGDEEELTGSISATHPPVSGNPQESVAVVLHVLDFHRAVENAHGVPQEQ